ncbi:transforming growth factor beta regulator 1 [Diachasma alloeum]|uniref:transforming growth factor beta regulator 1 n=1 Tax=Diachasma alloeum TaxID=454923 RepID=UPI0007382667|nr:transforming growth factor beta regulator 1 [Diachasma alloeum]
MSHPYERYCNSYHQNAQLQENLKYKKKYKKLKRIVKNLVFENAALCDQVSNMQENLVVVNEERLFLLRKLCQFQGETDSSASRSQLNFNSHMYCQNLSSEVILKRTNRKKSPSDNNYSSCSGINIEVKPKARRYGKTAKKMVQLMPLDVHGRPRFPISLGDLTVYSLGEVITDRVAYHTEDHIYPVGFCSTRVYASLKNPRIKALYTCKILDGGANPRFEIVSDCDLDQPLVGASPDECHVKLLSSISSILCNIPPKGGYFFGVSQPTIQNLIQSSPGTRRLSLYKTQRFEVSKSQPSENGMIAMAEEEMDPGINFSVLHRTFAFISDYRVKEEPCEHDI